MSVLCTRDINSYISVEVIVFYFSQTTSKVFYQEYLEFAWFSLWFVVFNVQLKLKQNYQ